MQNVGLKVCRLASIKPYKASTRTAIKQDDIPACSLLACHAGDKGSVNIFPIFLLKSVKQVRQKQHECNDILSQGYPLKHGRLTNVGQEID